MPMVTVSTTISAHEVPGKCVEAVQRIFPDFHLEREFSDERFPIKRDFIEIAQDGVAVDFFLQLLSEQRILDTALDAMSLNMVYGIPGNDSIFETKFLVSRQAALVQKIAFVLESERTVGGVIEVKMLSPDLPEWLQDSTWHPGRREIPRSVGDDISMRADGVATEWFDKKGQATIKTDN